MEFAIFVIATSLTKELVMGQVIFKLQKLLAVVSLLPIVLTPQLTLAESSKVFTIQGKHIEGKHQVKLDFSYAKKLLADLPENATLGQFYDKANRHLNPKHREQFLRHFSRMGAWRSFRLPQVRFGSDSILLTEANKKAYQMQFVLNDKTYIKVNGKEITYQQLHRPKELYKQMGSITGKSQRTGKYSFLMNLFLPKAEAFLGGGMMGLMLLMMMMPMLSGGGGGSGMSGLMSIMPMMMIFGAMGGGGGLFGSSSNSYGSS